MIQVGPGQSGIVGIAAVVVESTLPEVATQMERTAGSSRLSTHSLLFLSSMDSRKLVTLPDETVRV